MLNLSQYRVRSGLDAGKIVATRITFGSAARRTMFAVEARHVTR